MGLRLCSLSSGSSGNCIFVASDTTALIIDAGIPFREAASALKMLGAARPSVLITHSHSDHIGKLDTFSKNLGTDVYCHADSYLAVERKIAGGRLLPIEGDFFVGDLTVSPFKVSHDVPCVGYSIYCGGKKISVATDLGCVTDSVADALAGSDLVLLEANHDERMLSANPAYPAMLKQRIMSARGHLSNTACGNAAALLAERGVKQFVLGHLSEENNYPELAHTTVREILLSKGIREGSDVGIEVVGAHRMSDVFEVV